MSHTNYAESLLEQFRIDDDKPISTHATWKEARS